VKGLATATDLVSAFDDTQHLPDSKDYYITKLTFTINENGIVGIEAAYLLASGEETTLKGF